VKLSPALVVASLLFYFFVIANPSTPVSGPAAISPTPAGR
jgi:hypothetical protein